MPTKTSSSKKKVVVVKGKEWEDYLATVLPTEEDEEMLINDYMKQEWIQYREWKGD